MMNPCRNAFDVPNENIKLERIATAARRHGTIEHRLGAVKIGVTEAIGALQQSRERRKRERLFGKRAGSNANGNQISAPVGHAAASGTTPATR